MIDVVMTLAGVACIVAGWAFIRDELERAHPAIGLIITGCAAMVVGGIVMGSAWAISWMESIVTQ